MEKGYRYMGTDMSAGDTPYEAGLGFCVALDKGDFVGRDALAAAAARPLERGLRTLVVGGEDYLPLYGGEAVRLGGEAAGRVRSCAYGFTVRRNIAYAYLPPAATEGTGARGRGARRAGRRPRGRRRALRPVTRPRARLSRHRLRLLLDGRLRHPRGLHELVGDATITIAFTTCRPPSSGADLAPARPRSNCSTIRPKRAPLRRVAVGDHRPPDRHQGDDEREHDEQRPDEAVRPEVVVVELLVVDGRERAPAGKEQLEDEQSGEQVDETRVDFPGHVCDLSLTGGMA